MRDGVVTMAVMLVLVFLLEMGLAQVGVPWSLRMVACFFLGVAVARL